MNSCNDPRLNIFNLVGVNSAANANVRVFSAGLPIQVTKLVNGDFHDYTVRYLEHKALSASIIIQSIITDPATPPQTYKSGVVPLRGVTVTGLTLLWTFTKGGSPVDVLQNLNGVDYDKLIKTASLSGLSLVYESPLADREWTIYGDDELSLDGSLAQASTILNFGDKVFYGVGNSSTRNADDNTLATFIQGLDNSNIMVNPACDFTVNNAIKSQYVSAYFATPSPSNLEIVDTESTFADAIAMSKLKTINIFNGAVSIPYDIYVTQDGVAPGGSRFKSK